MALFVIYSTHWHIICVKLLWKIEKVITIRMAETKFCCDKDDIYQVMVTRTKEAKALTNNPVSTGTNQSQCPSDHVRCLLVRIKALPTVLYTFIQQCSGLHNIYIYSTASPISKTEMEFFDTSIAWLKSTTLKLFGHAHLPPHRSDAIRNQDK